MALVLGTTYENTFYSYVLKPIRKKLQAEYVPQKVYISPSITHADNLQVRLWGSSTTTEDEWTSAYQKRCEIDIVLYLIEKNPSEPFYELFYREAERMNECLFRNCKTLSTTVGSTTMTLIDGTVDETIYNDLDDEEAAIDGLNSVKISYSCLIEKQT